MYILFFVLVFHFVLYIIIIYISFYLKNLVNLRATLFNGKIFEALTFFMEQIIAFTQENKCLSTLRVEINVL